MPLKQQGQIREPYKPPLDLPPAFRLVRLREAGDAFAHAFANASSLGAGTIVLVGRFGIADFAVVLEPDQPLHAARRVLYAGMVALCDALAALAPPEKPIAIEWPDAVLVDGGLVGGGRLGWPEGCIENAVPDWLVFGVTIRTVFMPATEAGLHPSATGLQEEGFEEARPERILEGFGRHFMLAVDRWQELGFPALAREYLPRLQLEGGVHLYLSPSGDLDISRDSAPAENRDLLTALRVPSWLDPATGSPRL